jgi:outer membrane protein TolC
MNRSVLVIMLILLVGDISAQTNVSADKNLFLNAAISQFGSPDLESELIPLDSIINIAIRHSPSLKIDSIMIGSNNADITLEKRRWQNNLTGFANYAAGNQRFFISGNSDQGNLVNGYRYGINFTLPLSEFTTKKIRISQQKAKLNASKYRKDQTEIELRKQVIMEYNSLIATQRILKIKTVAKENAIVLQQIADKQFHEGTTSIQDYATVSDITNNAEASFEMARSNFNTLYRQFEELVGVQLTSLMKNK